MAFPCMIDGCDQEFNTLKEQLTHMRDPQAIHGKPVVTPDPPPVIPSSPQKPPLKQEAVPKPVAEPIELVYRVTGQCDKCFGAVEAIEVELEKENMIVAWCPRCKKKLKQFTALPIGKQKEQKPVKSSK